MYENRSSFHERSCMIFLWTGLWVFLAPFVTLDSAALLAGEVQTEKVEKLSLEGARPVWKAIDILEARYGWRITYEDPPYVHESEIKDVTEQVRKDLHLYEKGKAPKVIGPKGGQIDVSYNVSPKTGRPDNPAALIQMILDAHAARGNPGVFRLIQTGGIFHVVPVQAKNKAGQLVDQGSILDARIILPEQERTGMEMLGAIIVAVSQATQVKVVSGLVPINLNYRRSRQGAANETARDVLIRFLHGTKLSWRLFYSPSEQHYLLHLP